MTPIQASQSRVSVNVNTTTEPRAVIYARVSVDDVRKGTMTPEALADAASLSVRAQLAEGRRLAEAKHLSIVAELVDDGVSGYRLKGKRQREAYTELVALIARGGVDVLIVRHADRAGRNDAQNSMLRIASAEHGVRWFLTGGGELNLGQSGDKLNLQMTQAVAEYQSAVKSEALRNVYGQMRTEGRLRATTRTFGWQWEKGNVKRSMLAEPIEQSAIQNAYRALLGLDNEFEQIFVDGKPQPGKTLYSIIQSWNANPALMPVRGAAGWSYASVRAVLLRPSNAGFVSDGEGGWLVSADDDAQPLLGKWETMIPEAIYLRARALLTSSSRRSTPGRKAAYLASGIAKCGVCGGALHSSSVAGKGHEKGERIPVYRCVSKLAFVADPGTRHVSARITDHTLRRVDPVSGKPKIARGLDSAVRDQAVAAFAFGPADLFPNTSPDLTSALYDELDRVESALREIGLALEDGAQYASLGANLKRQEKRKLALLEAIGEAAASQAQSAMLADIRHGILNPGRVDVAAFAAYRHELGERFDGLPLDQRRALVRALLEVTVLPLAPKQFGPRRWHIVHRVVKSLNPAAELELTEIGPSPRP